MGNLGGVSDAQRRNSRAGRAAGDCGLRYTFKGWMLPSIGDPRNHSNLLSPAQMEELRQNIGLREDQVWDGFAPDTAAERACRNTAVRLRPSGLRSPTALTPTLPADLDHDYQGSVSSLQIYGLVLTDLARNLPEVADRIVTVSRGLRMGGWSGGEPGNSQRKQRVAPMEESSQGQHISPVYRKQPVHDAGAAWAVIRANGELSSQWHAVRPIC